VPARSSYVNPPRRDNVLPTTAGLPDADMRLFFINFPNF
jgi:hypothetical protein